MIRDCLVRIAPGALDQAPNAWDQAWGVHDDALAMDGKTVKNARDEAGLQTHIMIETGSVDFSSLGKGVITGHAALKAF